ncbi:MAG TPA: hypothetical protein VJV79_07660 [Polyangiaceae bacterium]|nr:hypothetical protein [Polyangiaceae bacterium]
MSHQDSPFSARIRAEIEAMGLQIVPADALDAEGAGEIGAAAHVIESPPPRRVELWLKNETTGQLALDRVLHAEQVEVEPGAVDATSAVRVSEQLRAFFQPLREGPAAARLMPPRPPPPPLKASAAPQVAGASASSTGAAAPAEEGRFFQELAAAVPLQPGSLGLDLLLRARLRFGSNYGLGAKLVLPVVPSTVSSGANAADVSAWLIGVELSTLLATTELVTLGAHAGLSLLWLSASGQANAPYTDRVDHQLAALPSLGTQVGFRLSKHVRLCLGAELGVTLPKLELAFAGQSVASWGQPFALFSAGVGAAWGRP